MVKKKAHVEEKFVSGLSFELRIPLNIPVSSQLLFQQKLSCTVDEYFEKMGYKLNVSSLLRDSFFESIGVKNEKDFISKNKDEWKKISSKIRILIKENFDPNISSMSKEIMKVFEKKVEDISKTLEDKDEE